MGKMWFVKENSLRETEPNGEAAAITFRNISSVRDGSCSLFCSNKQGPLKKRPYLWKAPACSKASLFERKEPQLRLL